MQICTNTTPKEPVHLVHGNLYQHQQGAFYIYSRDKAGFFLNVKTGDTWPASQLQDVIKLTDVTGKYCLQEK